MKTSKTIEQEVIHTHEDKDGNITQDIVKTTSKMSIDDEPDFIKIYTKMWLEYNQIPVKYRQLFFSLACRMSYTNSSRTEESQIVYVQKPALDAILQECGWTTRDPLTKGLKVLCDLKAIRKVARACYQINPDYASRGEWKYNPKLDRGGVKDLKVLFDFKDHTVDTKIVYADDGTDTKDNEMMRDGLEVKAEDETVITHTRTRRKSSNRTGA